jgi:hypothetical protein
MIEPESLEALRTAVRDCVTVDRSVLEQLRNDIRPLRSRVRHIKPRSATAVSLVGTDGGNNQLRFDPFLLQLIRVVDSSQNEHCLEAISRRTPLDVLDARHFTSSKKGNTQLGRMMEYLGIQTIEQLSPTFKRDVDERSSSWVQVYREMTEWAVLFSLVRDNNWGTDTIFLFDGDLRSKMFTGTLFAKFRKGLDEGIRRQFERNRRRLYVAGVLKHSRILETYRLAMALEGVMRVAYPCYVDIPRGVAGLPDLERKVFRWKENARDDEIARQEGGEENKFVGGRLYFCKFGGSPNDPIWAIDILESHSEPEQVDAIFGYLFTDAIDGFPVPYYPQSLQRAHENAALVDFDFEILQDEITKALRGALGEKGMVIDELSLQESDVSGRRYG